MLANALMAGICSVGANAVYAGVIPTPAVAYLTRKYNGRCGCSCIRIPQSGWSITELNSLAAHGYKLAGFQLEDEIEAIITGQYDLRSEFPIAVQEECREDQVSYLDAR